MAQLAHDHVVALLLTVGTLLATARLFGEIAARLRQPAVIGELIAGIVLGPSLLGRVWPAGFAFLFPQQGPVAIALSGLNNLALVLFLFVAGLEVDLSAAVRRGRAAIYLGATGIALPFALGFCAARLAPEAFGQERGADPLSFALFFATAMSISALPVIAKTLMDLHIHRSDLGVVVMAAAIFNDLAGWIIFAVILGLMGRAGPGIATTVAATVGYWVLTLAFGRWAFHRALPWLQAYTSGTGGILAAASALALLGAAFTEWIGIHAIFGSFMVGVAFGDTPHLREHVRRTLSDFVSFIFAPLFFASIGLSADFVADFDLPLTLAVLAIACVGKVGGCMLGGKLGGMSRRETGAAAVAMNARGAMEIILGLLALRFGLIGERLFVALVVMALLTSLATGPLLQRILRPSRKRRVVDCISAKAFVPRVQAREPVDAIRELCAVACPGLKLDPDQTSATVIAREQLDSTALGSEVAVPHARLQGLASPAIAIGLSPTGIDFDAPDGKPARIVFLLLTPAEDDSVQLELLADIAERCTREALREQLLVAASYTEFRALLAADAQERP